jgi:hypothetical protein
MTAISDLYEDLDGLLSGPEPDYDAEPEPPADADRADQMLRQLARLQRERDDALELAAAERARIDLWLSATTERITKRQAWYRQSLEQYHRAVLAHDPQRTTIRLPFGSLVARAQQPEWAYEDEAAFIAWATESYPTLLRQPDPPAPAPDKVAVKKALEVPGRHAPGAQVQPVTLDGELVPGVVVTIRDRRFNAEPGA